ncbi:MAG TPA: TIGR03667 family PPOX class F420-dependent oxidoreductase [Acidimicrobiia bacterium]|nr:TIGR03667 family PPOX class F420-dependent oxidoreductase [Acidimicrobiia bacterium]
MSLKPAVEERLAASHLIWLTTVTIDCLPQPSLVWFWWDGDSFVIYSQPKMPKLANIERNPGVTLNLDAMGRGQEEVTIIAGTASVDDTLPPASENTDYREKYRDLIENDLGMTVEQFSDSYSVPIRVLPGSVRMW